MLKHITVFQNAKQQLDLRPVAPEPAHVDRFEVIKSAHREDFTFVTPAASANLDRITHLFPKDLEITC